MKDSNNAAPSKTVGNHHYAKSEQFLLITIVLFEGRLDWGKWRETHGGEEMDGRRRCTTADRLESRSTASLSGVLKTDGEIYVSYNSRGERLSLRYAELASHLTTFSARTLGSSAPS